MYSDYAHRNHNENIEVRTYKTLSNVGNFQHQETENENYFEETNDYLDGTMNV